MAYDLEFFVNVRESAARSATPLLTGVVDSVLKSVPESVLDVGCGPGAWLAMWSRLGVREVVGVDGDYLPPETLAIPPETFRPMDISAPFDLGRRFDLVMSLEVAEHLDASCAEVFVDTICRHGDLVLFSAAVPGQGGEHHVNEQPYDYWRAKFAERGYDVFDCVRGLVARSKDVEPWYRYNTLIYANKAGQARLSEAARQRRVTSGIRTPLRWKLRNAIRLRIYK